MNMVHIFTESKGKESIEHNFIRSCMLRLGIHSGYEISGVGGWNNLKNLAPKLIENQDNSVKNVIIFDADYAQKHQNGGYKNRKQHIENMLNGMNIKNYSIFLFPNNQEDGDFEVLLENIINQKHLQVLKCFENYEECLKSANNHTYEVPTRKSKMYAYVEAFSKSVEDKEKFKKGNWFFDNCEYWNMNAEYLTAFMNFLRTITQHP